MEAVRDLLGWTVRVSDTPDTRVRLWPPLDTEYHDGRWILIVDFICEGKQRHGAKRADTPEETFGLLNECLHPDDASAVVASLRRALQNRDDYTSTSDGSSSTTLWIAAAVAAALISVALATISVLGLA